MSPFSRTSASLGIPKVKSSGLCRRVSCDVLWWWLCQWMYLALSSPLRGFLLCLIVTDLPPSPPPAAWCAAMNTCLRCLLRNALEPLATPCLRDVLLCEQGKNFDISFFCICASWLLITCCVASHYCCILFPAPRSCFEVAARSRNPGCASIIYCRWKVPAIRPAEPAEDCKIMLRDADWRLCLQISLERERHLYLQTSPNVLRGPVPDQMFFTNRCW